MTVSVSQPQTRIQPTGFTIYGLTRQATRQHLLSNPDFTDMLLSPRGFRMRLAGCLTCNCRSDDFYEIYMKRTTCAMKSGLRVEEIEG